MKFKEIFSFFSTTPRPQKPFKVQNSTGDIKFGVTANSLQNLRKVIAHHLKVNEKDLCILLAADGTEVDEDDYFQHVPPQTLFVAIEKGESWLPENEHNVNKLHSVLKSLLDANEDKREMIAQVHDLMQSEDSPAVLQLLGRLASTMEMNIAASERTQHPEWFKGVDDRFKTKEDFMKDRARSRVRGYLYTARDYIKEARLQGEVLTMYQMLLEQYETQLKIHDYYSHYFDRSVQQRRRNKLCFCDQQGWFECGGLFNEDSCSKNDHVINPYGSAEGRVVFSTWNLDHGIEKSREVLPCLVSSLNDLVKSSSPNRRKRKLNQQYFYDLLFTRKNLKLVHPACHDKHEHTDTKCDQNMVYIQ